MSCLTSILITIELNAKISQLYMKALTHLKTNSSAMSKWYLSIVIKSNVFVKKQRFFVTSPGHCIGLQPTRRHLCSCIPLLAWG